jgi:hypothetical protein
MWLVTGVTEVGSWCLDQLAQVSAWYATTTPSDTEALIGLSATAGVVWAGSLIVYTVGRRQSLSLGAGLEFLTHAFYVPLARLSVPLPIFRLIIGGYGLYVLWALVRHLCPIFVMRFNLWLFTRGSEARASDPSRADRFREGVAIFGVGFLWVAVFLSVAAFASSERFVLSVYLALFILGINLVLPRIQADVDAKEKTPRTPRRRSFLTNPLLFWALVRTAMRHRRRQRAAKNPAEGGVTKEKSDVRQEPGAVAKPPP